MTLPQSSFEIIIQPSGSRLTVPAGTTILNAARLAGVEVSALCGGKGTCGACKVQIISGEFSASQPQENHLLQPAELKNNTRLACLTQILSDCKVHFPPESLAALQRLQLEGTQNTISPQPAVKRVEVDLSPSSNQFKQSEVENVREAIKTQGYLHTDIPNSMLQNLTAILQENDGKVSAVMDGQQLVAFLPPTQNMLGLAVDLGTTKIAAYLVDLQTGETLASAGALNPQVAYGEDVISRIQYVDEHADGGKIMQQVVVEGINSLVRQLTGEINRVPTDILDCVIAGNTAMHHLLAGLPVHNLGTAPYHPSRVESMRLPALEIGVELAPKASLYLPPNVAGFVGGDHIAMLLATRVRHTLKTVIALDIGTNTEISLLHKGRHLACSCASGPAFEGAHIGHGLRAVPGAIERVFIGETDINIQTIGSLPAIGVCGSGILDAVAELRRMGMIDARGSFDKNEPRFARSGGKTELILVPATQSGNHRDITINREDVQEIQLAKAAIRSGIEVLLRQADIQAEDIDQFLIAGAFGTFLDVSNCQRIGMFPPLPIERFRQVGNAAGSGAREMLLSTIMREEAERILEKIEYVELTTVKDYVDFYMEAISL